MIGSIRLSRSRLVNLAAASVVPMVASAAIVVASLMAGCGPKGPTVHPVEGVVTLGGNPLEGADVIFWPTSPERPAAGITDAAGRYRLTTPGFKPRAGALAGDYAVTIQRYKVPADVLGPAPSDPAARALWQAKADAMNLQWRAEGPPSLTAEPYADRAQSGLSATVVAGLNTFDFALENEFKGTTPTER